MKAANPLIQRAGSFLGRVCDIISNPNFLRSRSDSEHLIAATVKPPNSPRPMAPSECKDKFLAPAWQRLESRATAWQASLGLRGQIAQKLHGLQFSISYSLFQGGPRQHRNLGKPRNSRKARSQTLPLKLLGLANTLCIERLAVLACSSMQNLKFSTSRDLSQRSEGKSTQHLMFEAWSHISSSNWRDSGS